MKRWSIIAVLVVAVGAVAAIVVSRSSVTPAADRSPAAPFSPLERSPVASVTAVSAGAPRLLDLGATACVPCKMMAPILEELKTEYAGRLQVDFIDVWKNEAAGAQYGISSIPTQTFFDATGKELYRHVGFMPKDDILGKCEELGFRLHPNPTQEAAR